MGDFEVRCDAMVGIAQSLVLAQKKLYEPHGLVLSNLLLQEEGREYGACSFDLNKLRVAFRVAKITPTKTGQFVTFWKRSAAGPIEPFDESDPFDVLVVSVSTSDRCGQFIFPKSALVVYGLISKNGKGGKRAMRVYSPWDITGSVQAQKTQAWQVPYFVEIGEGPKDVGRALNLFF